MNVIQAINAALDDAMAADENVFLLGEDIGDREEGGVCLVTKGLSTKYGEARVRSTPITSRPSSAPPSAPPSLECARWRKSC